MNIVKVEILNYKNTQYENVWILKETLSDNNCILMNINNKTVHISVPIDKIVCLR